MRTGKTPGVTFDASQNRWRANLRGYGKNSYIGTFLTKEEATEARRQAEIQVHGKVHEEASIKVSGADALVPLMGRAGTIKAWAVIDAGNVGMVEDSRWSMTASGYAIARIDGGIVYMHTMLVKAPFGWVVDHIDGNKLNNLTVNLRACQQIDNARNRKNISKNNTSGYKGVSKTAEGKWRARITDNRKEVRLGHYDTQEEAALAYNKAALEIYGEFAAINIIQEILA
jgi:hypothetical protein